MYYSDQRLDDGSGSGAPVLTKQKAKNKFGEFLRNFTADAEHGLNSEEVFKYRWVHIFSVGGAFQFSIVVKAMKAEPG